MKIEHRRLNKILPHARNVDKTDPMRTHDSDVLGYMISYEFSMQAESVFRSELLL